MNRFSPLAATSKEAAKPRAACGVGAGGIFSVVPPEVVAGVIVLLPKPELVDLQERAEEVVEGWEEEIACPDNFPEPAPEISTPSAAGGRAVSSAPLRSRLNDPWRSPPYKSR